MAEAAGIRRAFGVLRPLGKLRSYRIECDIVFVKEDRLLPAIPAQGDMVRHAGQHEEDAPWSRAKMVWGLLQLSP